MCWIEGKAKPFDGSVLDIDDTWIGKDLTHLLAFMLFFRVISLNERINKQETSSHNLYYISLLNSFF